ncbi:type IV pilus assembly protein FimV [Pseudomonas sp. 11/12A]|uniref:type IV pilus assembly protein FimV n=1 Tax=Pseudomonas sp. 11/12A TaxID=1506582 RepID=UPI000A46853F|nr:peptidoglycan-binding protein LysM [Pseudomonas sp. 11/12A]
MLESRLFVVRCCTRLLLVGAVVTYSALASALGLGEMTVHSALNQPLRADIALMDAAGLEEGELSVSLATADEFSRAGVERVLFLDNLKFTPVLRGNRRLIQVTSNKPVNEPFLNFLVQLNQPNGRLLREYTVLIDPPGSPNIVPATDEPLIGRPSSEFPSVQPATAPLPARKEPPKPAAAPLIHPLDEQLAASVLQNQQLQASVDELKAKLLAQGEQIAAGKKQVAELQTRLAEVQLSTAEPDEPAVVTPTPVVTAEPGRDLSLIFGLPALALVVLGLLGWFVRRRRQPLQTAPEPAAKQEPVLNRSVEPWQDALGNQGEIAAHEAQQASLRSSGFAPQEFLENRARHPGLSPVASAAVPVAAASGNEFQLNLDDLSMGASWGLIDATGSPSSASTLPEPDIEWELEPVSRSMDGSFLVEFAEPVPSPDLEPPKQAARS